MEPKHQRFSEYFKRISVFSKPHTEIHSHQQENSVTKADLTHELHGNGPCALCGRNPAAGYASIGDRWYCHGDNDPEPTCYMRASRDPSNFHTHGFAVSHETQP